MPCAIAKTMTRCEDAKIFAKCPPTWAKWRRVSSRDELTTITEGETVRH